MKATAQLHKYGQARYSSQTRKQRGIALIAALFIVVIIGAAVVLMALLSIRNSQQTTQNLLHARAQMASAAAIEYSAHSLAEGSNCAVIVGVVTIPAFPEFTVSLTCVSNAYNKPSQSITIYQLTATVSFGTVTDADYVWTELQATIEL